MSNVPTVPASVKTPRRRRSPVIPENVPAPCGAPKPFHFSLSYRSLADFARNDCRFTAEALATCATR